MRTDVVEQAVKIRQNTESRISRLTIAGVGQARLYCADTGNPPSAESGIFCDGAAPWEENTPYEKGDLFAYNGAMGFVKQAHTSQAHWIPFSTGTEALYGARPAPDEDGIYPYVYNMAAAVGMKVREGDAVYECIQPISDMLYPPSMLAAHFVLA